MFVLGSLVRFSSAMFALYLVSLPSLVIRKEVRENDLGQPRYVWASAKDVLWHHQLPQISQNMRQ